MLGGNVFGNRLRVVLTSGAWWPRCGGILLLFGLLCLCRTEVVSTAWNRGLPCVISLVTVLLIRVNVEVGLVGMLRVKIALVAGTVILSVVLITSVLTSRKQ